LPIFARKNGVAKSSMSGNLPDEEKEGSMPPDFFKKVYRYQARHNVISL